MFTKNLQKENKIDKICPIISFLLTPLYHKAFKMEPSWILTDRLLKRKLLTDGAAVR